MATIAPSQTRARMSRFDQHAYIDYKTLDSKIDLVRERYDGQLFSSYVLHALITRQPLG